MLPQCQFLGWTALPALTRLLPGSYPQSPLTTISCDLYAFHCAVAHFVMFVHIWYNGRSPFRTWTSSWSCVVVVARGARCRGRGRGRGRRRRRRRRRGRAWSWSRAVTGVRRQARTHACTRRENNTNHYLPGCRGPIYRHLCTEPLHAVAALCLASRWPHAATSNVAVPWTCPMHWI